MNQISLDSSGLLFQHLTAKFLPRVMALASFLPSNLVQVLILASSTLEPDREGNSMEYSFQS